jgi:peptide/nickel transport system substrate-binding protein
VIGRRAAVGLAAAAFATTTLAAPAVRAQASAARTLRFAPHAPLANLDPIWGTQYVVRNAGMLVWDTLYGIDSRLEPKPQMAEAHEISDDRLVWTIRLRSGLRFHDGEPVRGRDVVASLERWMVRHPMGQAIRALREELSAPDDRTIRLRLSAPYPRLLQALGAIGAPCAFIMPERIARTDPFTQIDEVIGSGPMRFRKDEWDPGARAVFERFERYEPRDEPADWIAGGKRIAFDRIEWIARPDPAATADALQNGELDWWEQVAPDYAPVLRRNRQIGLDIADPLGNIGSLRFNHLHPPFNDVRARRAVAMVVDQADYMRAVVGDDDVLWRRVPSFFTPETPLYSDAGGEILSGPRDHEAARRLLAESGYDGQPITLLVAEDVAPLKAMGQVTHRLLRELGCVVDYVATDWGTVARRRAVRSPPATGGWNIFHTWHAGVDCASPAGYTALRTNGDDAWFGWPNDPGIERLREAWFAAATPAEERAAVAALNRASMAFMTWVPTGLFMAYQAWRRTVSGIVKAPLPLFWGVAKA